MAKKHRMPGAERVDIYRGVAGDLLLNSKSEKPLGISDLGTLAFSTLTKFALYREHCATVDASNDPAAPRTTHRARRTACYVPHST